MNVTFHTLAALGTAAALSSKEQFSAHGRTSILLAGFGAGVLLHGVADYLPHSYPIAPGLDTVLSLTLFAAAFAFAKRQHRLLIGACFLGALFPDLVDLGPSIINHRLGWSVPAVKIFPWHWRQYSGSIYDGSRLFDSLLLHLVVIGLSVSLLYTYRRELFALAEDHQSSSHYTPL